MTVYEEMLNYLDSDKVREQLGMLYGANDAICDAQAARYKELVCRHEK